MRLNGLGSYAAVTAVAVALDQWVKYLIETQVDMHLQVDILPVLALYRTHNTGIAFSLFSGLGSLGLIVITLAVVALVGWIAVRTDARQQLARFGFALIIGGAIGNLIDRAVYGHVIDYILFHTPVWSFAVFNLADAFITVGAIMVLAEEFLGWRRQRADADTPPD